MADDGGTGPRGHVQGSERFQIESVLGQGGMAVVYAARDRVRGHRVAVKRMRTTGRPENLPKYLELFEREYLTLVQLRHPRIVDVYDYGVDDEGPYYTMELLNGGDLLERAPVEWKKACSYARDVCSALALLHSRRMVHRDLSPQNVRCTGDGLAKLIDFGAMMPFGSSRELVGTLPYVPPEAVHQQPLDARTDLYALGATLYYTLTQRHAYPARDVTQLRDFWRSRPRRPSELVAGVPEALDALVGDLMQLDPTARPANAAEVMARLGAIAGLRSSEQVLVSQAYLSNPTLVGRTTLLIQARKQMLRACAGRGVALMVRGAPGLGRSRFLDACVLEGKLAGLTILHADASAAQKGSYGVVRLLSEQLLSALGPLALETAEPVLPLLGHAIPKLVEERPEVVLEPADDPEQHHRRVQQALRHFFVEVAKKRALLIAIDDLSDIDESSAAFVALLAQEVADTGIVIVTTVSDESARWNALRGAVEVLASSSTLVELAPLDLPLTEQLLSSVFGEVPNVKLLARYVHGITEGNPRDVMRLAQHLVTEGMVRYQAGQWSLPAQLESIGLPASMADALATRIAHLSDAARALAQPFALEPTQTFSFAECGGFTSGASAAHLMQTLDELVTAEVLSYAGERYGLRQRGWVAPIRASMPPEREREVHGALAALFERRGAQFRAAEHLLRADQREAGLDLLLQHAAQSEQRTDVDVRALSELLTTLPRDWLSTYERGLALVRELGRPAIQRDILHSRLAGLVAYAVSETDGFSHTVDRLNQLRHDAGLDLFAALPPELDHGTRLKKALEQATVRYQTTPPHERVLDPGTAIKQLPKTVLAGLGTVSFTCSYSNISAIPSLAPVAPLSPALSVVQDLADGLRARVAGRSEEAIAKYERLIVRISQPDRAGLTPVHHLTTHARVLLGLGTLSAAMGQRACLVHAEQLEREPAFAAFAAYAMFIRHIHHVWQGNTDEAARCKQQIELVRIESNAQWGFEGQHVISELAAYALAEEMTLVQRATDAVATRAAIHRAWQPVLHFGRGEYLRLSGDYEGALEELEEAVRLIPDAHHQIWASAAGGHLRALLALGRAEQACELGPKYLETAARVGLGYLRNYVRMPLALALGKIGAQDEAVELAQVVIDELRALGSTGLNLAAAYETRARIDIEFGDRTSFEHYASLCAEQSRAGERRLVGAKYQRLVQHGSEADPSVAEELPAIPQFTSSLDSCHNASDRARCGLAYLARHSGARGGVLYTHTVLGLVRSASFGEIELENSLDTWAQEYFAREVEQEVDATAGFSQPPPAQLPELPSQSTLRYVPVLLTHQSERGYAITGVALLITAADAAFVYPSRLAAELSRSVAQAGDVVIMYG